jgi:hypothetical protein
MSRGQHRARVIPARAQMRTSRRVRVVRGARRGRAVRGGNPRARQLAMYSRQQGSRMCTRRYMYCTGNKAASQCCGSESEIIRMFWLDPNPKNKFGYGFGFRHCCRMKIFVKNQKSNTWKRKILCFSIENFFYLTYRFQNTFESN